jgi:hypothetical protein
MTIDILEVLEPKTSKSQLEYNREFIRNLSPEKFPLKLKMCQDGLTEAR